MNDLLQAARQLHSFGLNILPVRGKVPNVAGWKTWQATRIPEIVLSEWSWNSDTTGLAVVLGFNNLRDIEFDNVGEDAIDNIVETMLTLLPGALCYRSGSRKGLHFLFRCEAKNPFGRAVTNGAPKVPGQFHHAELRWEKSLSTVPPSKHESGFLYDWLCDPVAPPPIFTPQEILSAWQSLTAEPEKVERTSSGIDWNVEQGSRHNALCSLVGKLKSSKLSSEILPLALAWNRGLAEPLPEREIVATVESLTKDLPPQEVKIAEPSRIPLSSLSEYLSRVESFLRCYVVFPSEHESLAVALWVAHSWIVERFEVSPILALTSAEMRSGKTRVLDCLELLVPHPFRTVLPSEAVTYSILAQRPRPTFFLDEADAIFSSRPSERTEGLRAIFNSGNAKGTPVFRVNFVKGQRTVEAFDCYGPKVVAGIGQLPSTVADRSVLIRMRRRSPDEPIVKFRRKVAKVEAQELCFDWGGVTLETDVPVPDELNDRAADSWEPLLAIADAAGGDWPQRARRAAIALSQEEDNPSTGMKLLADIREVFGDADHLETGALLDRLHELEASPWAEWYGKPLTARGLAKLLEPYRVRPVKRRLGSGTMRGYFRTDFADAWKRYTPSNLTATSDTSDTESNDVADVALVSVRTEGEPEEEALGYG